ncbi:MAG TPA: glycosyltransferase, partial [Oleiagrimonas sp.]|nr:glycosyltransferase [Oleiagrimonas sp.]
RLLFLGRWHPNKGVDLLLDALGMLDDADWSRIEVIEIQGGGPMETLVRERVTALRAHGRPVELGRYLAKPEAEAAIARADWVVIPSRIESIPVVFSDAMKLGRPVVASRVGDLPRLLDASPACGILAAAATPAALHVALHDALHVEPSGFFDAINARARMFELAASAERLWVE